MAWWKKDQLDNVNTAEWQELQTPEGLFYYFSIYVVMWEKPDALKTAEELRSTGDWVWAPHPQHCFVPAKIYSQEAGMIYLQSQDGEQLNCKAGTQLESLLLSSLQRICPDLVLLDVMNNPLILHNLRKRFERDDIYTNVGTILISINPYKHLNLYKPEVISAYRNKPLDKEMPPHVFNIAADALFGVMDGPGKGQSIIISGESGAGKTEATKQCLSYVAAVAGSIGGIERKILQSNPILESFGNAKTIRNDNSSRFGKYIEVFMQQNGQICGSRTQNFLLEKVRVIKQAPNERNFHVFYQLCYALSDSDRRKYELGGPDYYRYLCTSGCTEVPTIDDCSDYEELLEAMNLLDFSDSERDAIFSIIAAILHLGNIEFQNTGDRACKIRDISPLNSAARLLEVPTDQLIRGLTVKQFRIVGQKNTDVTLSDKEAQDTRDALAKFIYGAMFDWIVQKINKSMVLAVSNASSTAGPVKSAGFGVKMNTGAPATSGNAPAPSFNPNKCIGILDIFGFEIFEQNSFEQLCINFCNEKLQHHFSDHTFKLEEQVYQAEGIQFSKIKYIDNGPVLELIEAKPSGILRILDEELIVPKGSDSTFLQKAVNAHSKNQYFKNVMRDKNSFMVVHYAGQVIYDSTGFLEKNRDTLTEDLFELLGTTKKPFIFEIFPNLGQKISSKERKASLGFQFSKQLENLMNTLNMTEPHYIRCVKPNNEKRSDYFIAANVLEQLRYSGVFEAVSIRRSGFPFRQTHTNFVDRYAICNMDKNYPVSQAGCKQIISDMKLPPANVQMGRTMVLYRSEEYKMLELHRSINLEKSTITEKLQSLIDRNPANEKDPEFYFQELSRTVRRAKELHFTNATYERARDMLFVYIENRIDPKIKQQLEIAHAHRDQVSLDKLLDECAKQDYDTSLVRRCRHLRDRMNRIVEEATNAIPALEERPMKVCINAADEIGFQNEIVEYFKALLFQTPADVFAKEQLKAAVKLGDHARAIRITLRLKDMFLSNAEDQFQFSKYGKLKPPKDWADEKWVTLDREKLALGMLVFDDDWSIHKCLVDHFNANVPEEECDVLDKQSQSIMRKIFHFVEQGQKDPYKYAVELISLNLSYPKLRDETYLLLMKQMTRNPDGACVNKLWDLMAMCLCYFPPNVDFENYLEVFLRQKAQPRDKWVGALNKMVYEGVRPSQSPPTASDLQQSSNNLTTRSRGFSEPLPMAQPPYMDLMNPFEDVDPEAEVFTKKAPKVAMNQQSSASKFGSSQNQRGSNFGGDQGASKFGGDQGASKFGGAQNQVASKFGGAQNQGASNFGGNQNQGASNYGATQNQGASNYGGAQNQGSGAASKFGGVQNQIASKFGGAQNQGASKFGGSQNASNNYSEPQDQDTNSYSQNRNANNYGNSSQNQVNSNSNFGAVQSQVASKFGNNVSQNASAASKFGGAQSNYQANQSSSQPALPARSAPPKKQSDWQSAVDPASGDTYYYNAVTGESSWDEPDELKYKHVRAGSRV